MFMSLESNHENCDSSGDENIDYGEFNILAQPDLFDLRLDIDEKKNYAIDDVSEILLFDAHFCADNECTIEYTENDKSYYCNICGIVSTDIEMFMNHRYTNHADGLHSCYNCSMRFRTPYMLMIHTNETHNHSEIFSYVCHKCSFVFMEFDAFEDHLTTRRCCYIRDIRRVH